MTGIGSGMLLLTGQGVSIRAAVRWSDIGSKLGRKMAEHKAQSHWNNLEIAKLAASILTPVILVLIAYLIDRGIDEERRSEQMQGAAQDFSRFVYERYTRSALLWSALKRNANNPVPESRNELIERKRLYDEAYLNWNRNILANMFLMRKTLGSTSYSAIEHTVNIMLVKDMFTPLDKCLTDAYDMAIRDDTTLRKDECEESLEKCVDESLNRALTCGRKVSEYLFKVSVDRSADLEPPNCE